MRRALAAVALALACLTFAGGSASAAPSHPSIDILCKTPAPPAQVPGSGLRGTMGETRPDDAVIDANKTLRTDNILANGGYAGLESTAYDNGCDVDPTKLYDRMETSMRLSKVNAIVAFGQGISTLTTAIEAKVWSPDWIAGLLGRLAKDAITLVWDRFWVAGMVSIGLIATTAALLYRAIRNDPSGVIGGLAWMGIVLIGSSFILVNPIAIPSATVAAGQSFVNSINSGSQAETAATAVQYSGYLRRTFGSEDSALAKEYGIPLLAASRLSWAEERDTANDPKARDALIAKDAAAFKKIADDIKERSPNDVYPRIQGQKQSSGEALFEATAALFVNLFRLMTASVVFIGAIFMVILGITWLAAAAYTVTPAGQAFGRSLFDKMMLCIANIVVCAIGAWLYILWTQFALAPGNPDWLAVFLMVVGTVVFWTAVRPDRKMLSLMSLGHISPTSQRGLGRLLKGLAFSWLAGRVAGETLKEDREPEARPDPTPAEPPVVAPPPLAVEAGPSLAPRAIEAAPTERIVHEGEVIHHGEPGEGGLPQSAEPAPDVVEGEVIYREPEQLPDGTTPYQRPLDDEDSASSPPSGAVGEVELYNRPEGFADSDESDTVATGSSEGK